MRVRGAIVWLVLFAASVAHAAPAITSTLDATAAGDLVLTQEVHIEVPIALVWAAYTTDEG